jgi:hypothetical protein
MTVSGFRSENLRSGVCENPVCPNEPPLVSFATGLLRRVGFMDIDMATESGDQFLWIELKGTLHRNTSPQQIVGLMSNGQRRFYTSLAAQPGNWVYVANEVDGAAGREVYVSRLFPGPSLTTLHATPVEILSVQEMKDAINAWLVTSVKRLDTPPPLCLS